MIKRWMMAVFLFLAVLLVCWVGGLDFDRRSPSLAASILLALYAASAPLVFLRKL